MADKSLPFPPTEHGRATRFHTRKSLHSGPHTSQLQPLSPVAEVPQPSELQTLQLENDILSQQLSAMKRLADEKDRMMDALEKEKRRLSSATG